MNAHHLLLSLAALLPFATWSAPVAVPYKEVMDPSARSMQPAIYARASEYGFGVQYVRPARYGTGVGGVIGGMAGGLAGQIAGSALGSLADSGGTKLSALDAEKLAPLYDREAAQRDLEAALASMLPSASLFSAPVVVKPLLPGAVVSATVFPEDPVLIVELYSSLITDYRGLQVTAIVYELSGTAFVADPKSPRAGRVYRNRFDHVSELLPAPPFKSAEQLKAEMKAVKARYQGRKLTKQEKERRDRELDQVKRSATLEKWREPLLAAWLEKDGALLREALKLGTQSVADLLAKDLMNTAPVEIRKVDALAWRTLQEVTAPGRYTSLFVGGPFAGALISEPSGLSVDYCQDTAFSASLPKDSQPRLCAGQQ